MTYTNNGTDDVVVTESVSQPLDNDYTEAFTSAVAISPSIKGVASTVGTEESLSRQATPDFWSQDQTGTSGNCLNR